MARIPAKILRMYVRGATLADALPHLRETYCGTIAYEIEHISSHRQRVWLREKIESGEFRKPLTTDEQRALLQRLVEVDALERFMHKAYLGQKQFSIEGLDTTVPMLDEMIQLAAAHGAREVVVGMAHRGRLNVLAHNLGRPYETIFAEFEGASTLEAVTSLPQGGTGDVKYHHGAQGTYQLPNGDSILVNLESNPSHLEYVHPVVLGATRAAQTGRQGPHARRDTNAAVPLVLHGDAAFPGQGVVAESLNLQAIDGYKVGGTLHLIQNNQVGFTTDPEDSRSTRWASDLAKGYDTPIIHVNADDVAGCISAVRLAFAFRQEFGHDVVIDLIGYRRFGHNEADEPAYTQPEMYAKIKSKKRVTELWAEKLVETGVVTQEEVEAQRQAVWDRLTELHQRLKAQIKAAEDAGTVEHATGEYQLDRSPSPEVATAVPADELRALNDGAPHRARGLHRPPEARQAARAPAHRARRATAASTGPTPSTLAFASLLTEGVPVRLTGQDAERGTFSQRHMVLHDAKTGQTLSPIQNLAGAQAAVRAAQLAAERGRMPRLRVRLLAGGAGDARALGGAVRRLRQLRPGHRRPVHRLRPGEVGPDVTPDAAAAARLRGLGPRALLGPPRALPPARRRGQPPRREPHDAGAVLPPAPPPGEGRQAAPARDHDAEVAAAPAAGDEPHRAPLRDALLPRPRRAARADREGHAPDPLHRQDLLRPRRAPEPRGQRARRRRPRRAALPLPRVADHSS